MLQLPARLRPADLLEAAPLHHDGVELVLAEAGAVTLVQGAALMGVHRK